MEISSKKEGDSCILAISGIVGLSELDEFESIINDKLSQNEKNIILDFRDVDYIDSSGIGLLVRLNKAVKNSGAQISFTRVKDSVMRILKITGVDQIMNFIEESYSGRCRDCKHYIPVGEGYGNCSCSQISGYDLVVQADSGCDSFEPANSTEKKNQ